jgi:hypothetical protein
MILVGVLLMFLSLQYLHLSANEAFISSLLERPLLSLALAASAILVTYQIGLFVHFFLTKALWMGQNGWYFEKLTEITSESFVESTADNSNQVRSDAERGRASEQTAVSKAEQLQLIVADKLAQLLNVEEGGAELLALLHSVDGRKLEARQLLVLCHEATHAELKLLGCSTQELELIGIQSTPAGLKTIRLRELGYATGDLREAGFQAARLKALGYNARELGEAGYTVAELKDAGFSLVELRVAGCGASQLMALKVLAKDLARAGFPAVELLAAGTKPQSSEHLDSMRPTYGMPAWTPSACARPASQPPTR